MNQLKNKDWWMAAGVRALKTIAQTAVATIGTATLVEEVNWLLVASASIIAGLLSLLTSLAGLPEVPNDDPLIDDESEEELINEPDYEDLDDSSEEDDSAE